MVLVIVVVLRMRRGFFSPSSLSSTYQPANT